MATNLNQEASIDLGVKMAGIRFRSPVGVAAVAHHFGKDLPEDQEEPGVSEARVLLKHIQAGAGYVYILGFFATKATQNKTWRMGKAGG